MCVRKSVAAIVRLSYMCVVRTVRSYLFILRRNAYREMSLGRVCVCVKCFDSE